MPHRVPDGNVLVLEGRITIEEFSEDFQAPTGRWGREDYIAQWHQALTRLLDEGRSTAFIVAIGGTDADLLLWWLAYPMQHIVYVRQQLLNLRSLESPFSQDRWYDAIPAFEAAEESPISEWEVPLHEFALFRNRLKG